MAIDVEALKQTIDLAALVGHYTPIKKRGAEYVGKCVAHSPDNHPSMWIAPAKGLIHCFSCGFSADAISFLQSVEGVDFQEACRRLGANRWQPKFMDEPRAPLPERLTSKPPADAATPSMKIRELGEPSHIWPYRDTDGGILGYVARYETQEGKQIRAWTYGARGNASPSWGCGQFSPPRPLYGLDRLAQREDPVVVVEGEKAADAATRLLPAYVAVTWSGGALAWHKADWTPLAGRKVLLWPDNDAPGLECMHKLGAVLADQKGLACSVRLIDPNRMPEGFDAADWTGTSEELIAWAKPRAKDYPEKSPPRPPECAQSDAAGQEATEAPPEPQSLLERPKRRKPQLAVVGSDIALAQDDAEPLPVSMSEDALADAFAALHHENWRYVARWGLWFKWGGDVWREDDTQEVYSLARDLCRTSVHWPEGVSLGADQKRKLGRRATAGAVRDMAGTDRRIAAKTDQWDANAWLLGVPGGVVDLRTGELAQGKPEQFITKKCSVAPARGAHPLFDQVLERASSVEPETRAYLLRWLGYMLTGDTREECFLFLHGPGGSGKGTLVRALADILGDYAKTISMEALVESHVQRHSQELAKLARARFVYASETEEGRRWNEALIKWLTGRDKVTAHFMRENDFEFYPQFKLLIYGNHIPHVKSVGEEIRRRVHLVEYAGSIERPDTSLKDRLIAEYPAILHSMIQGCLEWQTRGLDKPSSVIGAIDQYLESEDTIGTWLADNIERDPTARAISGDVYRDFKLWAQAAGEYVISQKRFVQAMRLRGFESKRDMRARYISGLALKNPPIPDFSTSYPQDE